MTPERVKAWAPWGVLVVALLLIAFAAGRPSSEGPPLDPTSTGPLGTKAVVDTLGELGVSVDVRELSPRGDDTTALLLIDDLDDAGRQAVREWVEAGGTLVVTDVFSPLNPGKPDLGGARDVLDIDRPELDSDCDIPALGRIDEVAAPSAVFQEPPSGSDTCFRRDGNAWFISLDIGEGTVVALGGASALINANLDEADNALLAIDLLAPTPSDRVVVLQPPGPGEGDRDLASLIASRVKLALAQLAIAFVLVALWRSRRLGRPVLEPQPVQIEASELVVAVGELMQRARAREQAATVLRDDLRRSLAEHTGLSSATPPDVVAEAVAARHSGLGADDVLAVLAGPPPSGEDVLVALSQRIESIRAEILGRPAPSTQKGALVDGH